METPLFSGLFSGSPLTTGFAIFVAGALAVLVLKVVVGVLQWRSKSPHRVGTHMHSVRAEVTEWAGKEGYVRADGELWRAESNASLSPGDEVKVSAVDGLTLKVVKA